MANKRSIYLINPRFQIKFSLFVCSLVFLSSIIYPWTIYELFDKLMATATDTAGAELKEARQLVILWLSVYQLVFIAIIFVICIFQSHKIAGPIYKLGVYLKALKNGSPMGKISLRKGDNFPEIAQDYNEAMESIQDSRNKDFSYLSEVTSYINNLTLVVPEDKKVVLVEISNKLAEMQERFKNN